GAVRSRQLRLRGPHRRRARENGLVQHRLSGVSDCSDRTRAAVRRLLSNRSRADLPAGGPYRRSTADVPLRRDDQRMGMLPRNRALARARARRKVAFVIGLLGIVATGCAAVVLGSGCIFDEGGYDGGGRRVGAPTAKETEEVPTSTSTSTSTPDAGTPPKDTGV